MKWKKKPKKYPKDGEIRIRWVFPIVPLTINGETRWLWFYRVEQQFCYGYGLLSDTRYDFLGFWRDNCWVD